MLSCHATAPDGSLLESTSEYVWLIVASLAGRPRSPARRRDWGLGFVQRSPRSHENQCLTDLGHRLLVQADEHLGAHPDAPLALPEPLASASSCF